MVNAHQATIKKIRPIFQAYSEVKLVYFFGSKLRNKDGPLSDYDFAVYLDEKDSKKRFKTRIGLINQLSEKLQTDKIDLCVLNDIQSPELKYDIIQNGKLIYEKEPFKVLLEPRILNEYFDFVDFLRRYELTQNI